MKNTLQVMLDIGGVRVEARLSISAEVRFVVPREIASSHVEISGEAEGEFDLPAQLRAKVGDEVTFNFDVSHLHMVQA